MTALLPHRTLEEPPVLVLTELIVDGLERPERMEPHLSRIDLSADRDASWNQMQVSVSVSVEDGELAELLDSGMVPRATLVVYCTPTNLRLGRELEPTDVDG